MKEYKDLNYEDFNEEEAINEINKSSATALRDILLGGKAEEYHSTFSDIKSKERTLDLLRKQHQRLSLIIKAKDNEIQRLLSIINNSCNELAQLKIESQKDHEDMRSFQMKYIEADQALIKYKKENDK